MIVTMTVKMMMNPICRDAARKVATRSTVSQLGPEQQKCIQFADKEAVKDTDPASRVVETRRTMTVSCKTLMQEGSRLQHILILPVTSLVCCSNIEGVTQASVPATPATAASAARPCGCGETGHLISLHL